MTPEVAQAAADTLVNETESALNEGVDGVADATSFFLDALQRYLGPSDVPVVNALFERMDLDAVPPSCAVILLACTRLRCDQYEGRGAFVQRFHGWLVAHGRSLIQANRVVAGLIR